jgi:hypothetical protein
MTDHRPEIVEIATSRIAPARSEARRGPSRRPSSVVVVLLVGIAIPAIAFVGPRIEWRPGGDLSFLRPTPGPSPTPTPRPSPRPTRPMPSPPPVLTIGEAPLPGALPIDVSGIRLIDPSTGDLTGDGSIHADNDAIVKAPDGVGWWCVCFIRGQALNRESVDIEVRHLDGDAVGTRTFPIRTIDSVAEPPSQDYWTRIDVEFMPDGKSAYVALGVRQGWQWSIQLEAIDLAEGLSLGRIDMPPMPVPKPTKEEAAQGYESWLAGPLIRLSPDGRRLIVTTWMEKYVSVGTPPPPSTSVSLVDVSGTDEAAASGPFGAVTPVAGDLAVAMPACGWLQWLSEDSLIGACWHQMQTAGVAAMEVTTFALDGARVASFDYSPDQRRWVSEPVVDRSNRVVYFWSPIGHYLDAVEIDTGRSVRVSVDPDVANPGPLSRDPAAWKRPSWASFMSDYVPWSSPTLLAEPTGPRLFAVGLREDDGSGYGRNGFGSTGIWVFDTSTLELPDHWPAAAAYSGIGLSRDGRWILAVGQPGTDADGNPASWPSTVSIHDARDGHLALRVGDLGTEQSVLLVP